MLISALMVMTMLFSPQAVAAQGGMEGWSRPEIVAQTDGRIPGAAVLLGDKSGALHMLFEHQPDNQAAGIDYMRWDGATWSKPNTIIVDAGGAGARLPRAVIDANQLLHLIWVGSGNTLNYASAPLSQAGSAQSWPKPLTIGTTFGMPAIALDAAGRLLVAYSNQAMEGAVAFVQSTDGGKSWSEPQTVAMSTANSIPADIGLAVDGSGRLHVVWTEYQLSEGNPITGAYYAQSVDGGQIWTAPLQVAGARHGQLGVTAVGADQVHLVWRSNVGGDGTFHQWSSDGGNTWFAPNQFEDGGGMSGMPSFAVDSLNRLHYVIGSVFYAWWTDGIHRGYVDIVPADIRQQSKLSRYGEEATMGVTLGNRLHVMFQIDLKTLWYTSRLLDSPELERAEIIAVAEPPNSMTVVSDSVTITKIVPMPIAGPMGGLLAFSDRGDWLSPTAILFWSASLSVLFIGVTLFVVSIRRRR